MFTKRMGQAKVPVKIHMKEKDYHRYKNIISKTIVDRAQLMTATDVWNVIPPGGHLQFVKDSKDIKYIIPKKSDIKITPKEAQFKAIWYSAEEKLAKAGPDANTFGDSGTLQLIQHRATLQIPVFDARYLAASTLAHYGAALIPINQCIRGFNISPYPLAVVSYSVHPDYVSHYLFDKNGGGGAFIESHITPHAWIPLNPNCRGALILGTSDGLDGYSLIGINIPFGYVLTLKGKALHSDSYLIGDYAMVLSADEDKGMQASTVLLRTPKDEIQAVRLVSLDKQPNLQAEIRLAASSLSFFKKMQKIYLEETLLRSELLKKTKRGLICNPRC